MLRFRYYSSAILAAFFITIGSQAAASEAEFRAFWVDGWEKSFKNAATVRKLVADVRAAHCNAVFVQVRRPYVLPSASKAAVEKGKSAFDPLAEVIREAHDTKLGARIEVHAWFLVYPYLSVTPAKTNSISSVVASSSRKPFIPLRNWVTESDSGAMFNGTQYSYDPGNVEVQSFRFKIAMDIISRYDIDGLQLDHVRYPGENWGYNKASVARFNRIFNRTGKPLLDDPDWSQFRRDQITALIRKIYISGIATKPSLKISVSTVTWPTGINSEAQWNESMPYRIALQDWRGWMEEGILDINLPMVFYKQAIPLQARAYSDWSRYAKDHQFDRHMVISEGSFINSLPATLAQTRIARELSANGNKARGVAFYSYEIPAKNESQKAKFLSRLSSDVFKKAVLTPEMPWKSNSKTGHLMGFLHDEGGEKAMDGATIYLGGTSTRKLISDGTGFFGAVDLQPGEYSMMMSFKGFNSVTNHFSIKQGKVTTAEFTLNKASTK